MRNTIHHHTLFIQMFNNKLTFTLTSCAVWLAYLCEVLCCIYSAKHWQYKCCCFSCSRLRLSYHVVGSEIWTKQSNYFREVVSAWDQWSNLVNLIFPTFLRTHIDFAGFKISSKTPFYFSWKTSNMPPPSQKKKMRVPIQCRIASASLFTSIKLVPRPGIGIGKTKYRAIFSQQIVSFMEKKCHDPKKQPKIWHSLLM